MLQVSQTIHQQYSSPALPRLRMVIKDTVSIPLQSWFRRRIRDVFMSDCDERAAPDRLKEYVRPDSSTQLLRITVSPPMSQIDEDKRGENSKATTGLWSGPRQEVWEQVKVGTIAPRYRIFPLWLPNASSTFFNYLSTLSLSLFIFNLFALPFLDGSHFLSAMLDYIGTTRGQSSSESEGDTELDIELGVELGNPSQSRTFRTHPTTTTDRLAIAATRRLHDWTWKWRRRVRGRKASIERGIKGVTIALMCTTVIGMALSA